MTMITLNHHEELHDFEQAVRRAHWRDWFSFLTRKCNKLLSFDQVSHSLPMKGYHDLGLRVVPVDKIIGSTGRYQEFDRAFLPRQTHTKDRWVKVDEAYYKQVLLPPVTLIKVGEVYFVSDGNHRISVARAHKQAAVDAYVTELNTPVVLDLATAC